MGQHNFLCRGSEFGHLPPPLVGTHAPVTDATDGVYRRHRDDRGFHLAPRHDYRPPRAIRGPFPAGPPGLWREVWSVVLRRHPTGSSLRTWGEGPWVGKSSTPAKARPVRPAPRPPPFTPYACAMTSSTSTLSTVTAMGGPSAMWSTIAEPRSLTQTLQSRCRCPGRDRPSSRRRTPAPRRARHKIFQLILRCR